MTRAAAAAFLDQPGAGFSQPQTAPRLCSPPSARRRWLGWPPRRWVSRLPGPISPGSAEFALPGLPQGDELGRAGNFEAGRALLARDRSARSRSEDRPPATAPAKAALA